MCVRPGNATKSMLIVPGVLSPQYGEVTAFAFSFLFWCFYLLHIVHRSKGSADFDVSCLKWREFAEQSAYWRSQGQPILLSCLSPSKIPKVSILWLAVANAWAFSDTSSQRINYQIFFKLRDMQPRRILSMKNWGICAKGFKVSVKIPSMGKSQPNKPILSPCKELSH